MCIMCGCTACAADDYLGTQTDAFNLKEASVGGNRVNLKWGSTVRGSESGIIRWSADLSGLSIAAGTNLSEFTNAVSEAFDAWAAIAGLTFQFVANPASADIRIGVGPLGGSTIGLATTSFVPNDSNGSGIVEIVGSEITMDQNETWRPDGDGGSFTFVQVLIHEIGHALGLNHFDVSDSIMNSFASSGSRTLGDDDIAGIQNLYGARRWDNSSEEANFKHVGVAQTAFAAGGNDELRGTDLGDTFHGEAGNDMLYGRWGNDGLFGGLNNDTLYGGAGNDNLHGEDGSDTLIDTRGTNNLFGGDGNDEVFGGGGVLIAEGNEGNDLIIGGIGDDTLNGGDGDDTLHGDPIGSFIAGDDTLIAGAGNDELSGGGGSDNFVFNEATGINTILDFEVGFDTVELQGFSVSDGTLMQSGGNTIFTYNQNGVSLEIRFENAIVTEADFM